MGAFWIVTDQLQMVRALPPPARGKPKKENAKTPTRGAGAGTDAVEHRTEGRTGPFAIPWFPIP